MLHALDGRRHQGLGLRGAGRLVRGDPRDVLADVGHLQQVGVQAGVLAGAAEGLFVQVRRAGRHDHAGQPFLLDVILDQLLAERRAHELVVARDGNVLEFLPAQRATSSTSTVPAMLLPQWHT